MMASCAAANPGYRFRLFDPAKETLARPDFVEEGVFPETLTKDDLERFLYTLNGSTWRGR